MLVQRAYKTELDRVYHCEQCGLVIDRDLNAAINVVKLAGSSSDSLNACGAVSAGTRRKPRVKPAATLLTVIDPI